MNDLIQQNEVKVFSAEAEQYLLGACMMNNIHVPNVLSLHRDCFFEPAHKIIVNTIDELFKGQQEIEIFAVFDDLSRKGYLDSVGGMEYLTAICELTPSIQSVSGYMKAVNYYHKLRKFNMVIAESQSMIARNMKVELAVSQMQTAMAELVIMDDNDKGPVEIKNVLDSTLALLEKRMQNPGVLPGQTTGFKELDEMTGGFEDSKDYVIAARPGMGKSAFLINIIDGLANNNSRPWIIFSLEMASESLGMRMLSRGANINSKKLKSGRLADDDFPLIVKSVNNIMPQNILIDDRPGLTLAKIRAALTSVKMQHKTIGGFLIDHIGRIDGPKDKGDTAAMKEISNELSNMGKFF